MQVLLRTLCPETSNFPLTKIGSARQGARAANARDLPRKNRLWNPNPDVLLEVPASVFVLTYIYRSICSRRGFVLPDQHDSGSPPLPACDPEAEDRSVVPAAVFSALETRHFGSPRRTTGIQETWYESLPLPIGREGSHRLAGDTETKSLDHHYFPTHSSAGKRYIPPI